MSSILAPEVIQSLKDDAAIWGSVKQEIKKKIVGQEDVITHLLIALLCNSHVLLEGVPGLAKTTLVNTIAQVIGFQSKRIQFTPDLLPSDVIGTVMYSPKTEEFTTKHGPIFTNLLLADEINRAPAKVQSALLEAMQEKQVTIGDETFQLPHPFFVLATQNPLDQEGTYQLPEAQMDRFLFKVLVKYPSKEEERAIITSVFDAPTINTIITQENVMTSQALVKQVYIDEKVIEYLLSIVFATRHPESYHLADIKEYIIHGASPRATLALYHASKAHAFLKGRHFVIPDDIKAVAPGILRHRLTMTYIAEAESLSADTLIERILEVVPAP